MVISYHLSSLPGFNEIVRNSSTSCDSNKVLNKIANPYYDAMYYIIRYDKDVLNIDLIPSFGLCRSVIVNDLKEVIGFAPPKSVPADKFIKQYPVTKTDKKGIVGEEFVEGTMINVFFNKLVNEWVIATRNVVGAHCGFYKTTTATASQKTFDQMFQEAALHCNLCLDRLNKEFSYSFVLQHPENRIVVPIKEPVLYLVAAYKITNTDNSVEVTPYHSSYFSQSKCYLTNETSVRYPTLYTFDTYWNLIDRFTSMNTPYDVMGVVLYNMNTGERAKVRNPTYEQVRNLRGNQPKLQYQYLCLRKEGRIKDFLKYYPEYKNEFSCFRDQVHMFTNTLYENYVSCYIKKQHELNHYPPQFKTHMYTLHQHYLQELREKKEYITKPFVQKYVNELHPSLLMYCINYNMRHKMVDDLIPTSKTPSSV